MKRSCTGSRTQTRAARLIVPRLVGTEPGELGLLCGWSARWHMIWCEVDDLAGRALKYVVVLHRASVDRGATQGHRAPAIRARWVLLRNVG